MTTLSALLAGHLDRIGGATAGTCYVCGVRTETGHRGKPSGSFTAWAACVEGDVLCADCWACLRDRRVRGASWLVTEAALTLLTKDNPRVIWDALLDPPAGPYGIYLTRGRQKQGWIVAAGAANRSRARIVVATDWVDAPVTIDGATRDAMAPLLLRLRARQAPKAVLADAGGSFPWQAKATKEGWAADLDAARRYAGDPRWEVMVHAVP